MALFAIGDTHLSFGSDKSMTVFSGWQNYTQRLQQNWLKHVKAQDTVVLVGDISWAMNFAELLPDLHFLHNLPGKKILIKGNHDYWWSTSKKICDFLEENGFHDFQLLHNNSYTVENVSLCGTRGWMMEPETQKDTRVLLREVGRLETSLRAAETNRIFVFLHYPPMTEDGTAPLLINLLQQYHVERCYYGHLHNLSARRAIQGKLNDTIYQLISADATNFTPVQII